MNKKLFIGLFLSFILATIIGTLSHEFGHYLVARFEGYDAQIHYSYTTTQFPDTTTPMAPINSIAITLGGPVQTIFTGSIGLLLLFIYRKNFYLKEKLSYGQWLILFLALFWLRQTANFCAWMGSYFFTGKFPSSGDEVRIANYFNLPAWTILSITALIGAFVLALITFNYVPKKQRTTFLTAGFLGGCAGFYLWLILFGKYLLP